MQVPIIALAALALLALPSVVRIAIAIDREAARHALTLLGTASRYDADHRYVERFCVLYVPLWTKRGFHSTGLFD